MAKLFNLPEVECGRLGLNVVCSRYCSSSSYQLYSLWFPKLDSSYTQDP